MYKKSVSKQLRYVYIFESNEDWKNIQHKNDRMNHKLLQQFVDELHLGKLKADQSVPAETPQP